MGGKHFSRWDIQIAEFSREQTEILKGVGILLIVLHNIFHNMMPLIGQNEFTFHPGVFTEFYLTIAENPLDLLRAVFSYFGHYGVQIFVFFSAYGLTRKYNRKSLKVGFYLWGRVEKIYLSFLLCVFIYIILGFLKEGLISSDKVLYWDSLLWKVLLVSSFIPDQAMMPVGVSSGPFQKIWKRFSTYCHSGIYSGKVVPESLFNREGAEYQFHGIRASTRAVPGNLSGRSG
jgi:peptidoglycan/LPS O-acetylase OafA/YrhL